MSEIIQQSQDEKLANMLIAAGGDVALVAEKLNTRLAHGQSPVSSIDILDAFMNAVSNNVQVQSNVKALLLLNFLQILNECRSHLSAALPDFTSSDLIKTIQMVIEGIVQLQPPPAKAAEGTGINIWQQFGGDQARERVISRLETYKKIDDAYSNDQATP